MRHVPVIKAHFSQKRDICVSALQRTTVLQKIGRETRPCKQSSLRSRNGTYVFPKTGKKWGVRHVPVIKAHFGRETGHPIPWAGEKCSNHASLVASSDHQREGNQSPGIPCFSTVARRASIPSARSWQSWTARSFLLRGLAESP